MRLALGLGLPYGGEAGVGVPGGSPASKALIDETDGLALSFVDDYFLSSTGHYGSARVKDTGTPANNYNSHPFGLLTYAGASKKWVRGPSGLPVESDPALTLPYEWGVNEFVNPDSPETQMIAVDDESSYTILVEGSGSVTLSGAAAGTVSAGQPRTFKMDGTSLTVTVNGSPTFVHVREALGIRVEEQRTNLITWSQDFSKWEMLNALVTDAGDGLWKVERPVDADEDRFSAVSFFNANRNADETVQRSHFVDIVRGNTRYVYLLAKRTFLTTNDRRMIVDLDTLTITANDFADNITRATAEDIGGGVIRLSITCNTDTVNGGIRANLGLGACNSPTNILDVSVGDYVYAVRAQSEDGSFPTSYIQTAGSTVTRAADNISLATEQFPYNDAEGTVIAGAIPRYIGGPGEARQAAWTLIDSTTNNNYMRAGKTVAGGDGDLVTAVTVVDSNITALLEHEGAAVIDTLYKIAFAYKEDDFASAIDGGDLQTDTSGAVPSGITTLNLGRAVSTHYLNGHIKQLVYLPRRMSNTELQEITGA